MMAHREASHQVGAHSAHANMAAAGSEREPGDHDESAIVLYPTTTTVELGAGQHPSQLGKENQNGH